jgi:hypothetical protein
MQKRQWWKPLKCHWCKQAIKTNKRKEKRGWEARGGGGGGCLERGTAPRQMRKEREREERKREREKERKKERGNDKKKCTERL